MNTSIKKASIVCLWIFFCVGYVFSNPRVIDYSVAKIWDGAAHSAFTDLVEFKGRFYCAFREGTGHIPEKDGSGDGKIRVLVSDDGVAWKSSVLLVRKGFDLRDAKLSVTPDGRLMVLMGGSIYDKAVLKSRMTHVSFSDPLYVSAESVVEKVARIEKRVQPDNVVGKDRKQQSESNVI